MNRFFIIAVLGISGWNDGVNACVGSSESELNPTIQGNVLRHFKIDSPVIHRPEPLVFNPIIGGYEKPISLFQTEDQENDDVLYFNDQGQVLNDPKDQYLNDFLALGDAIGRLDVVKGLSLSFWGELAIACVKKMPIPPELMQNFMNKLSHQPKKTYRWFLDFLYYATHHLLDKNYHETREIDRERLPGRFNWNTIAFKWDDFWKKKENLKNKISTVFALFPRIIFLPFPGDITYDDLIQTMPNSIHKKGHVWLTSWMFCERKLDCFEDWQASLDHLSAFPVVLYGSEHPDNIRFFNNVRAMQRLEDYYMDNPQLLNDRDAILMQLFMVDFMRQSGRPLTHCFSLLNGATFEENRFSDYPYVKDNQISLIDLQHVYQRFRGDLNHFLSRY